MLRLLRKQVAVIEIGGYVYNIISVLEYMGLVKRRHLELQNSLVKHLLTLVACGDSVTEFNIYVEAR